MILNTLKARGGVVVKRGDLKFASNRLRYQESSIHNSCLSHLSQL